MEESCVLQVLLLDEVNQELNRFETQIHSEHTSPPAYGSEKRELDQQVALQVWKIELERQLVVLSDRQTAEALELEDEADESPLPRISFTKWIAMTIRKLITSLKHILGITKITSWAEPKFRFCACCRASHSRGFEARCSHFYCNDCLLTMVTMFLKGESPPPKCCNQLISGPGMKTAIGSTVDQKLKEKLIEFNDPDKTYCSNERCSRYIVFKRSFLSRLTTRRIYTCVCGFRTCRKCKSSAHSGLCLHPWDAAFEWMKMISRWQDCFNCGRVIERISGCTHMM